MATRLRGTFLIACILLSSCGVSQHFTVEGPAHGAAVIPLSLDSGAASVTVQIAGRDIPLLLDLGGYSTLALSDSVLDLLHIPSTSTRSAQDAYGRTFQDRNYTIPHARVGSIELRNVEASSSHATSSVNASRANGYLGYRFLKAFPKVIFDYPNKRLLLLRDGVLPAEYREGSWTSLPFYGDGVVTKAEVDGAEREFWWDTGANFSIIDPKLAPESKRKALGDFTTYQPTRFGLGGKEFPAPEFIALAMSGPGGDGLIGHPYFLRHTIILDFEHHLLQIR